ncbi:MAG: zf-HC2 domain-containing protein [Ktedonobacterales bacterium]
MSDDLHCADVEPYLSAFADGELAEPLRSEVAAHVRNCDSCTDEVDRHQTIDRLIATLPRTRPSPEVFARVQVAVAQRRSEYVSREPVLARDAHNGRQPPDTLDTSDSPDSLDGAQRLELPAAVAPRVTPKPTPITSRANLRGRKRARRQPAWVTGALPTIAALLLVAVALTLLLRFPPGLLLLGDGSHTTHDKPPSTEAVLRQTRAAVDQHAASLAFTPTLPTYLPAGARYGTVVIGPNSSGDKASRYLDVIWTFTSGPLSELRVREAPSSQGFPDYALAPPATTSASLFWGLPQAQQWQPLTHPAANSQDVIVGQQRAAINIVVDAQPGGAGNAQNPDVITLARIVSLSMDRPFARFTTLSPDPKATLHFTATVTSGSQIWQVDTYLNGNQSDVNRSEVAHVTGQGVNLLDTTLNGQTTRLDENQHLYQTLSAQLTAHTFAEPQQNITLLLYNASDYIADGEMWNMGKTQYQGRAVYAFALVNTPGVMLYADAATQQAIALVAQAGALHNPRLAGSSVPAARLTSTTVCQNYTVVYTALVYVTAYTFTAPDLTQSRPAQANQSLPTGFTCS